MPQDIEDTVNLFRTISFSRVIEHRSASDR